MVVKKFEARTMKEALEMVKSELGPEAIIIAARDNSRRYGLVGEGSVEITAAIQEMSLQKKNYVEKKMPTEVREKIQKGSARVHKEVIEKTMARAQQDRVQQVRDQQMREQASQARIKQTVPPKTGPVTRPHRYIDMKDEHEESLHTTQASDKLKETAQKAWKSMRNENHSSEAKHIESLRTEIDQLKEIFRSIREVPQTILPSYPGSELGLTYEMAPMFERLQSVGLNSDTSVEILKKVQGHLSDGNSKDKALIHGMIVNAMAQKINIVGTEDRSKFEVFIGAGGHGKTSTLVKFATRLIVQNHLKVAILSTDTQRFGSCEQLKIYCQILNVPFLEIKDPRQWDTIEQESKAFDKILVDSPGIRFKSDDEIEKLKYCLPPPTLKARVHLVISSTAKDQDAIELGRRFAAVGFDDVIFTALDEASQHGVLINFPLALGKPLHSFGTGSRVPEDLELATRERVIELLLGNKMTSLTDRSRSPMLIPVPFSS